MKTCFNFSPSPTFHPLLLLVTALTILFTSFLGYAEESAISPGAKKSLSPNLSLENFLKFTQKGEFVEASRFVLLPSNLKETDRDEKILEIATAINVLASHSPIALSDKDSGNLQDDLPPNRELLVKVSTEEDGAINIFLERVAGDTDSEMGSWWVLPYAETRKLLQIKSEAVVTFKIEALFPKWLNQSLFGLTSVASFFSFLLLLIFTQSLAYCSRLALTFAFSVISRRVSAYFTPISYPLQLFISIHLLGAGLKFLEISFTSRQVFDRVIFVLATIFFFWTVLSTTSLIVSLIKKKLASEGLTANAPFLPLIQRAFNSVIGVSILLFLVDGLGFNITALLAGLGVGGIAIALASQKTIENLFGGLVLFLDQPVAVGQFGKFGALLGTIEDIGIRSTKIRTIQRTRVSIPNAELIQLSIENFTVRDQILINKFITLRGDTSPEQLHYLIASIRKLLISHSMVLADPARVRLVDFTTTGIVIEIFCYIETSDWALFMGIQEDLLLKILSLITEAGTALSLKNVYYTPEQSTQLNVSKRSEIQKTIEKWKEEEVLPLPDLPNEEILRLRGTVTYPPQGSWLKKVRGS
jgi:MscS family membrane protein